MWTVIIFVFIFAVVFTVTRKKPDKAKFNRDSEKEEKTNYFEKHYEKNINSTISELNESIEQNRKESYEDYSLDDKMKFKAQKLLIQEKRNVEDNKNIQNHLKNIDHNLLESKNENYNTVNEIDKIIHSIIFRLLNNNEKSKIDGLIELKNSMSTKQFYETLFNGTFSDDIKEVSFDYKYLPDGKFEIKVGYSEYGSEYHLSWGGHLITEEDINFRKAFQIEKTDMYEAIKLYKAVIESEATPIITYINAAERISIILGKEKLFETDYFFLKGVYEIITKSSQNNNFGWFNPAIITKRLERAHKKIDK